MEELVRARVFEHDENEGVQWNNVYRGNCNEYGYKQPA